jgi:hypothetical protein
MVNAHKMGSWLEAPGRFAAVSVWLEAPADLRLCHRPMLPGCLPTHTSACPPDGLPVWNSVCLSSSPSECPSTTPPWLPVRLSIQMIHDSSQAVLFCQRVCRLFDALIMWPCRKQVLLGMLSLPISRQKANGGQTWTSSYSESTALHSLICMRLPT